MIPLGLAYLGAVVREHGHSVRVKDFNMIGEMSWQNIEDALAREIRWFDPDLVGITCNTAERFNMVKLAGKVKNHTGAFLIVGGPHVSATVEQTLRCIPEVDVVVRDEGESTTIELCEKLELGDTSWKKVRGISYIEKGEVVSNPDRELIEDLDKIPFPARDLFGNEEYAFRIPLSNLQNRVTGIVTSRGCSGRCTFCFTHVMWRHRYRIRSPNNIVDEMEQVLQEYPFFEGFWIMDDNFIADKRRTIAICREIRRRGLKIIWGCHGRVDAIDQELASEMASANCKMISFGIESGSDKILKYMGKGSTTHLNKRAIRICRENGIQPRGTFIFGYPGETLIDILKTIEIISYFEPNMTLYSKNVILFPDTPITRRFLPNFDWYQPLPSEMHTIAGVPVLLAKGDPFRTQMIRILARIAHWWYDLTHLQYLIKRWKAGRESRQMPKPPSFHIHTSSFRTS